MEKLITETRIGDKVIKHFETVPDEKVKAAPAPKATKAKSTKTE